MENIKYALIGTAVFFSICMIFVLYYCIKYVMLSEERKRINTQIRDKSRKTVTKLYKKNLIKRYIDNVSDMLSQTGANYMLKRKINPYLYILVCLVLAGGVAYAVNILFSKMIALGVFVIILLVPRFLLDKSNKNDNENMLRDISSIYDSLVVQTSAGMFIVNAIKELSAGVKNERLKTALDEFSANITLARMDIEEALDDFGNKFRNPHIDMLVLVLKQSIQSGQASEYLKDLQEQMGDIQHAIELVEHERADLKISITELLIYLSLTVVIVVAVFLELMNSLSAV